jgi:hypothetical protein
MSVIQVSGMAKGRSGSAQPNDPRLSGRPRVKPARDEPFDGRSAPTAC